MNTALQNLGWAIFRITAGCLLAALHGYPKLVGGVDRLALTVAKLGFPIPTFFAWCATFAEFFGGLLIALGLATRPAAGAAAFTMVVALYRHVGDPFAKKELALLYLAAMIAIAVIGGGRYSLDAVIRLRSPISARSQVG